VTPANSDLFRLTTENASLPIPMSLSLPLTFTSSNGSVASDAGSASGKDDLRSLKVVGDDQDETVFYRDVTESEMIINVDSVDENAPFSDRGRKGQYTSHASPEDIVDTAIDDADSDSAHEPVFASLAHTDAQRAEIARRRELASGRSSKSRSHSVTPETRGQEAQAGSEDGGLSI